MNMNRLITSVICSLVTIGTVIQADPTRPRLVVGIVVDQLRTDYIEYLQSLFGEKGFKRLMHDGAYLRNVDFRTNRGDAVAATALLYTGNYPAQNGVTGAQSYDRSRGKMQPTLAAGSSYSPEGILLSTIADEIAIDGMGLNGIYSIAADPQQAVIMAGHAGTSAAWIAESNGNWTTAPYYNDSRQIQNLGLARRSPAARLDTMQWRPSIAIERYPGITAAKRGYPFRHSFPRSDRDAVRKYLASPLSNRDVTRTAIDYIRTLRLGERPDGMDMLNIALTAAPYSYTADGDSRLELQDTYLRLDSDLGALFDAIDKAIGLDNALIYLSSTGYYEDPTADDAKYRIPTGQFSVKRAKSLLNAYLSATYGSADYIGGYADGHFYLNDKTISDKRLDADRLSRESRDFLAKMAGVAEAYTLDDILSGGDATLSLRNAIDPKRSGDIYVTFTPGWTVTDDTVYPERIHTERATAIAAPFFLMGRDIAPQVIGTPIEATVLAPTVTQSLRIRAPNGAVQRPLLLNSPQ